MSDIIPAGQPCKRIDVTVFAGPDGLRCESSDPQLVSLQDGQRLEILCFCRYSQLTLRAGGGAAFGPDLDQPAGSDPKMSYAAVVIDPATLQIDVANTNQAKNAEPGSRAIAVAIDGKGFSILLSTPPYQQVKVTFKDGSFSYSGDIDTAECPPEITFGCRGAAYFTLTGDGVCFATPAFVWDEEKGADSCIIDEGVDGRNAILTNLHEESDGTQHCFRLQVEDESQQRYLSEDPTIVNVTPPPDPRN